MSSFLLPQSNLHLYLCYLGKRGIVFTSLREKPVNSGVCLRGTIQADLSVRIRFSDLPLGPDFPPRKAWAGGLAVLWPGTWQEKKTQDLIIPIVPLLGSFQRRSDSSAIVGQLILMVLAKFRRTLDSEEWIRLAQNSIKKSSRSSVRRRAFDWLEFRDLHWKAKQPAPEEGLTPKSYPLLNWDFLDLIALAHWDDLKRIDRREEMFYEMAGKVWKISADEGQRLDLNHVPTDRAHENHSGFYQYLRKRAYTGFKRGRPTLEKVMENHGSDMRFEKACVSKSPSMRPDMIALSQLAAKLKRAFQAK